MMKMKIWARSRTSQIQWKRQTWKKEKLTTGVIDDVIVAGVEEFVRGREGEIVIQHGAPAPEIGRDIIHEVTLEGDLDQA